MAGVTDIIRRHGSIGALIIINVIVFVIVSLSMVMARAGVGVSLESWFCLPSLIPLWISRPWTLLTYMFTHTNPLHILFNMLWLAWFGSILIEATSQRFMSWLYIGGGIVGGLLYLWLAPMFTTAAYLLGASASVLAIMTAAAVRQPNYTLHLFFIGDVKLKWIAIIMILLAFLGLGGGNSGGEIAHLGGTLCGLVASLLYGKTGNFSTASSKEKSHRRKLKRSSRVISIMEQHRIDSARLDELLDKIHRSGFDSLTKSERTELEQLSKRVSK